MSVCFFFFQSQAKSIAEQKRFPFATDNDSTNEELGEARVGGGSCGVRLAFASRCGTGRQDGEAGTAQRPTETGCVRVSGWISCKLPDHVIKIKGLAGMIGKDCASAVCPGKLIITVMSS